MIFSLAEVAYFSSAQLILDILELSCHNEVTKFSFQWIIYGNEFEYLW